MCSCVKGEGKKEVGDWACYCLLSKCLARGSAEAAQTACFGACSGGTNAKAIPKDKLTPVIV